MGPEQSLPSAGGPVKPGDGDVSTQLQKLNPDINFSRTKVIGELPPQLEGSEKRGVIESVQLPQMTSGVLLPFIYGLEKQNKDKIGSAKQKQEQIVGYVRYLRETLLPICNELYNYGTDITSQAPGLTKEIIDVKIEIDHLSEQLKNITEQVKDLQRALPNTLSIPPFEQNKNYHRILQDEYF
ncbi:uncharacterized protein MONOS_11197 [Monocercomonoides exilis]|uniref:uncharacterized protein n=1 Tax=Monocercomonoides exilis TaxID=2049356 RepID=UPI00355A916B|nr:hypothetical protein MONOS_11197 [Monocercomonoides exilis]|eukprot:MONOS_11197.1-p1 / transcript=MONOS_11197.1 / gene=MONOS_11197 / organism=Monocercomonoides_exilis_PA203 / gene_product=unspecified product / transcript_product=unspecified product / location=Mono_scaffold00549:11893-12676(-) / protein_length=183 / sequence_SO=supercontig / SO=protein_coding / is_pseudo=false